MMKKSLQMLILLAFVFVGWSANALTPNWDWAKKIGGRGGDYNSYVATDAFGNIYVTGAFNSDTILFGTDTLTNSGTGNSYIIKCSESGNLIWAKIYAGYANVQSINIDANGNIYMVGWFASPYIIFGSYTLTNTDNSWNTSNLFIVKYDSSGTVIWAHCAGGDIYYGDVALSVTTDTSGNIYMSGYFSGSTITFGTTTLINPGLAANIFIVKYDHNGNVIFAKRYGDGTWYDEGTAINADAFGNIYMVGVFGSNSITFGSFTIFADSIANTNTQHYFDMYLVKFDTQGNVLFAKSYGGKYTDQPTCVTNDALGNIYVAGWFYSPNVIFGSTTLLNADSSTINSNATLFLIKYNSSGNVIYAKRAGEHGDAMAYNLVTDSANNLYMGGYFRSTAINFDNIILTNAHYANLFITRYDANGNIIWGFSSGGDYTDYVTSLASDISGNIFAAGYFNDVSITFGPTTLFNNNSNTSADIFLLKLGTEITTGNPGFHYPNKSISIYPNPATTLLHIHHSTYTSPETLLITDLLGTEVYKENLHGIDNTISISTWSAGIYFYEVRSEKGSERGKFMKE